MRQLIGWMMVAGMVQGVMAQAPEETPEPPTFEEAVQAFSVRPPDEGSPFFADRELARRERRVAASERLTGATGQNQTALYPRVRQRNDTALSTFTGFFTGMFSSVKWNPFRKRGETKNELEVEPPEFSLSDRREVSVKYAIRNDTKKIMRLDFPTTQRVEILTYAPGMELIDRWSEDRSFTEEEGIIFINPGERISYTGQIPTRDMVPYEMNTITAELVGYPDYKAGKQVTPSE
jgi:hypothetical protein